LNDRASVITHNIFVHEAGTKEYLLLRVCLITQPPNYFAKDMRQYFPDFVNPSPAKSIRRTSARHVF